MMQKCLMGLLTAGVVLFASSPANSAGLFRHRGGDCGDCGGCTNSCAYETVTVKKTITVYVEKWEDKEITCKVGTMVPHTVAVPHECNIQVPHYTDEQRTVTCYEHQTREVPCDITVCRRVPVCVQDCCGCSHTCWQTVQEVQHVTRCVHECVPVQKTITVHVCNYTTEKKTWTTQCTTYTCEYSDVKRTVKVCHLEAQQREIEVCERRPVVAAPCAAPAPCTTCASPCSTCSTGCGECHERHHHHAGCCR
jgi:hypothetical protein